MPISDDALLVYIDETGAESMSDPVHPIYGFGGIVVKAKDLESQVLLPWHGLKEKYFGDGEFPFHITDLVKSITKDQIEALNEFFYRGDFGRVGAFTFDKASIQIGSFDLVEAMIKSFIERIIDYIKKTKTVFDTLILIFEESPELDKVLQYLNHPYFEEIKSQGIIIHFCFEGKDQNEPGLEVADIVVHTGGRQARRFGKEGRQAKFEPDYEAVYKSQPHLTSFMLILKMELMQERPKID